MGTVRPGPHLAGVLCNSRAWKWATSSAKVPRPAAAASRGRIRRPGWLAAVRPGGARTETPRPAARPLPARPGPLQGLHLPPPQHSCGSGPRSPPPRLPERWPGRPLKAEPAGRERGARHPESKHVAERPCCRRGRAPRAPHPPAGTVCAAGRRPLTFGAADLPTPSGGNESCHGVAPRAPLACPACEAPPRSREGGCAPARVRPVALSSSSSFHYIIFSFSEGWVGAGSLEREETFATFLHSFSSTPPSQPWKNNVERGEELGEVKVGGRVGKAEGGGRSDNNRLKTD